MYSLLVPSAGLELPKSTRPFLQPEDVGYLKGVHAEAIQSRGLTIKHFELFVKHWEETLKEMGSIIPQVRGSTSWMGGMGHP